MRVTAILNLKGGVGKTTTAINFAAILAHDYAERVLLADADSQANATRFYQRDNIHPVTMAELLRGKTERPSDAVEYANFKGVSLIPADDSLMDLDLTSLSTGAASANCLREFRQECAGQFDFMIIDCPPAFNAASAAALAAADDVIVPIKCDAFSLTGMGNILTQVKNMKAINPKLRIAGILPTMTYRSEQVQEACETLKKFGMPLLPGIRRTPKIDEMTYTEKPIIISSPKSAAAKDYREAVRKYLGTEEDGKNV